jgi:hypothetical protein
MITVLCVRKDSIYKELGIDCYDADRDMRTWPGGNAIIAHPPCAQWGGLAHFAKKDEAERRLAIDCVSYVRKWGGVLEHPVTSRLYRPPVLYEAMGRVLAMEPLPLPGCGKDSIGGWSICINQHWFGHRAKKRTLLYIRGASEWDIPAVPLSLDAVTHVVATSIRKKTSRARPEISKSEREHTPELLARWLVAVAEICDRNINLK